MDSRNGERLKYGFLFIWLLTCLFMILGATIWVNSDTDSPPTCRLSNKDFVNLSTPLLLKLNNATNPNNAFYMPIDGEGTIEFKQDETFSMSCPGGYFTFHTDALISVMKNYSAIQCVEDQNFEIVSLEKTHPFKDLLCSKEPQHTARISNNTCAGNHPEYEIGFLLRDGRFLRHIAICYDADAQTTLYSEYELSASINGSQKGVERPDQFIDVGNYKLGAENLSNLYSRKVQRATINKLLGLEPADAKYIDDKDQFLSKGHLTAKADFVYGPQQSLTFYYINTVPQWQSFNGGNWNELEMSVRKFIAKRGINVKVFTGTYGITTLPAKPKSVASDVTSVSVPPVIIDASNGSISTRAGETTAGGDVPLYLYVSGNEKAIPVPEIFWKIVYEPVSKAAVAFIGVNNPHLVKKSALCTDICDKLKTWELSWEAEDQTKGYSYCCAVDDAFKKKISTMPKEILDADASKLLV